MSTTGSRIRTRRLALGLSVDELAAKLGKNRATIYRYESDEIENLPITVIRPLAEALDTTPAYLMGWEAEEKLILLKENEFDEINAIFLELNSDNRAKLLELGRLFLGAQRNSGEN